LDQNTEPTLETPIHGVLGLGIWCSRRCKQRRKRCGGVLLPSPP